MQPQIAKTHRRECLCHPTDMYLRMLLLAALLALPYASSGAGDAPLDRATLRGLKSVNVVIDRLDPKLEDAGLTAPILEARIEEHLRRGGVAVDKSAVPFLGLRVLEVRANHGPYALSLEMGVYQPVLLVRDPGIRTATQTWEADTVLMAGPRELNEAALDSVDELTDGFTAAWRSVNP